MFLVSSFDDRMTINAYTRDASIQQAWWRELGKRSWIPPYDDTGRSIVASLARAACEQQSLLAARSPPPPCQFLPWQSCLQDNSITTTCWIYTIMCELWAQLIRVEQPRSLGYERLILYTATSPWILFARVLYDGDSSLTWPSVCIYMAEIYTRLYGTTLCCGSRDSFVQTPYKTIQYNRPPAPPPTVPCVVLADEESGCC